MWGTGRVWVVWFWGKVCQLDWGSSFLVPGLRAGRYVNVFGFGFRNIACKSYERWARVSSSYQ